MADVFSSGAGNWSSLIEMEESITLTELYLLLESLNKREHSRRRFMGLLKGMDIDEKNHDADFERVHNRALAELSGKTEQEVTLADIVEFESDDDD